MWLKFLPLNFTGVYAKKNVFKHFSDNYKRLFPPFYGYDHLTNANEITQKIITHYVGDKPFNESFRSMSDVSMESENNRT